MSDTDPEVASHLKAEATVEAVVRAQLSRALGGKRGMIETATPTITFTFSYIGTKNVTVAIVASVSIALAFLLARLVRRSNVQYVVNALVGIGIGCFFVWLSKRNGGDASAQALAYFLPGIIYNAGYSVVGALSVLVKTPVVGLMVGTVSDEPFSWRQDAGIVKLCSNLTWVLVVPCAVRVLVQAPIYVAGRAADNADPYVTALGISKVAMGWPLQILAFSMMIWLLTRDRTKFEQKARQGD